jgi:hypothetical protein
MGGEHLSLQHSTAQDAPDNLTVRLRAGIAAATRDDSKRSPSTAGRQTHQPLNFTQQFDHHVCVQHRLTFSLGPNHTLATPSLNVFGDSDRWNHGERGGSSLPAKGAASVIFELSIKEALLHIKWCLSLP